MKPGIGQPGLDSAHFVSEGSFVGHTQLLSASFILVPSFYAHPVPSSLLSEIQGGARGPTNYPLIHCPEADFIEHSKASVKQQVGLGNTRSSQQGLGAQASSDLHL